MQGQGGRWSSQPKQQASANEDPFAALFSSTSPDKLASPAVALDPFAELANNRLTQNTNLKTKDKDSEWNTTPLQTGAQSSGKKLDSGYANLSDFNDNNVLNGPQIAVANNSASNPFDILMQQQDTSRDNTRKLSSPRARSASPTAKERKQMPEADLFNMPVSPYPAIAAKSFPNEVQDSIPNIIGRASSGDFSALRSCRSLHRKRALLAAAVDTWDADIILEVVLFLQETLRQHLLLQLLSAQPIALSALLSHLERQRDSSKLVDIYTALNRFAEAGMHMLNLACAKKDAQSRLASVGECKAFLQSELGETNFYTFHVADLHALLTRQIAIEERDLELSQAGSDQIWIRFPRSNIIGHPVNHLLRYCIRYHPNAQKNKLSNAKGIRDAFKISEKEWAWINLEIKAELGDWAAVAKLVQKTTFTRKSKCVIGFSAFVDAYAKYNGPRNEMVNYASKVSDPEQRYDLCMKYEIYDVAIGTLLKMNDINRLEKLRSHIQNKLNEDQLKAVTAEIDAAIAKCSRKTK